MLDGEVVKITTSKVVQEGVEDQAKKQHLERLVIIHPTFKVDGRSEGRISSGVQVVHLQCLAVKSTPFLE